MASTGGIKSNSYTFDIFWQQKKTLELLPHNWGTLQISWFAVYLKIAVLKSLWLNDSEQIVQSPWRPFLRFLATMIGSWWPVQARIIVALAHGFVFCCCEISMQSLYIVLESSVHPTLFRRPNKIHNIYIPPTAPRFANAGTNENSPNQEMVNGKEQRQPQLFSGPKWRSKSCSKSAVMWGFSRWFSGILRVLTAKLHQLLTAKLHQFRSVKFSKLLHVPFRLGLPYRLPIWVGRFKERWMGVRLHLEAMASISGYPPVETTWWNCKINSLSFFGWIFHIFQGPAVKLLGSFSWFLLT